MAQGVVDTAPANRILRHDDVSVLNLPGQGIQQPKLARIPIILCTAAVRTTNDPAMAEQLDRLAVRVVLKPFLIEDLLRAIADALTAQALIAEATDGGTTRDQT
jgi:DNA-binding NtrC family response regulator